jgi:phosphoglycolate phosphatase
VVPECRGRAVGFDLDMTLVDTRPGIEAALLALADETGRQIDVPSIVAALGPPIAGVLSPWFPEDELPAAIRCFRAHMAAVGVTNVTAMPGAAEAMAAARDSGYEIVVVTAKLGPLAVATLRNAGLRADRIFGEVWAERKAVPLEEAGAVCFVGDHPADMLAAVKASIPAFGVTTGSASREDLMRAGAAHVATSLHSFADWLRTLDGATPPYNLTAGRAVADNAGTSK